MVSLIVGLVLAGFCVFACLPSGLGLGWSRFVLDFLRGAGPVFAAVVGLIAFFIGLADLKDKRESKKEEEQAKKEELKK